MPTKKRPADPGVIALLLAAPFRFELVQALRLIEQWLRQQGIGDDEALSRHIRFHNSLSMVFAPAQIEALGTASGAPLESPECLLAALLEGQQLHVTPAYLSFFGVSGVLPHHYTDGMANQVYGEKYEGGRAFFDLFLNRIVLLHYQASQKHRVRQRIDEHGNAAILPMQLALAGACPGAAGPDRDAGPDRIGDQVRAYYAAVLRHRPVSALLIQQVLAEYFELPCRVEQFVGSWDQLSERERCRLGSQSAVLGHNAILGARCREHHTRVLIHLGPLRRDEYAQFLPGAAGTVALRRLLAMFATPTIGFDLHPILRVADVKPVRLSTSSRECLGMTTFLLSRPEQRDRGDWICPLRV